MPVYWNARPTSNYTALLATAAGDDEHIRRQREAENRLDESQRNYRILFDEIATPCCCWSATATSAPSTGRVWTFCTLPTQHAALHHDILPVERSSPFCTPCNPYGKTSA
jgi:hypothetical protein